MQTVHLANRICIKNSFEQQNTRAETEHFKGRATERERGENRMIEPKRRVRKENINICDVVLVQFVVFFSNDDFHSFGCKKIAQTTHVWKFFLCMFATTKRTKKRGFPLVL